MLPLVISWMSLSLSMAPGPNGVFTAQYGVCVVISWITGEVLDIELLSKVCVQYSSYKGATEGEEWFEGHKAMCTCTHTGSSPAMEVAGARKLFSRSVEK